IHDPFSTLLYRVDVGDVGATIGQAPQKWHIDSSKPRPVIFASQGPSTEVLYIEKNTNDTDVQDELSHLLLSLSKKYNHPRYSELDDLTEKDLNSMGLRIHRSNDGDVTLTSGLHLHRKPTITTGTPQPRTWVRTFPS